MTDTIEKIVVEMRELLTWHDRYPDAPRVVADATLNRWIAALAQTNDAGRGEAIGTVHTIRDAFGPTAAVQWHSGKPPAHGTLLYLAPPSGAGEPKIYTKADAEALCAIAVAAATSGTYESNCERIEKRLMEHRLSYTHGDDGDAYPLVDRLTPDGEKSIETGRKEIELLAENIADLFGKPEPPAGAAVRAAALEEAAKK